MSDMDFNALAARLSAGLEDIRACVVLSADGLTLGAFPADAEDTGRRAWDRLQEVGQPDRGFLEIDDEVWVLGRRGPYWAILVSGSRVRPGFLLDKVESLLRTAEDALVHEARDLSSTAGRPEAARRPRTSLHAERRSSPRATSGAAPPGSRGAAAGEETPVEAEPRPYAPTEASPRYTPPDELQGAARRVVDVTQSGDRPDAHPAPADPGAEETGADAGGPPADPATEGAPEEGAPSPSAPQTNDDVDRVALAREFGRLMADGGSDA